MLNPSMLQNAPTAAVPSSPPGSSAGNAAASNGGSEAASVPSFSKVLAGEMHDKEEGGAPLSSLSSISSGAMSSGTVSDISMKNTALPPEPAVAVAEGTPAKHAARAGSAAAAARMDKESMESPEENHADSLAGLLASLGNTQFFPAPAPAAVDSRIANTRSGARDGGPDDANPVSARSGKEETGRADIFPWIGGYSAGGTGVARGTADAADAATGERSVAAGIAAGGNPAPAIQMSQIAQAAQTAQAVPALPAKGKQSALPNVEENAGRMDKPDRADKMDRTDAGKPDAAQRNDFKFDMPGSGVADKPEKQGAIVTNAGSQPPPPSLSAAPQASFMAQPAERGFAMGDTGSSTAISVMQDLQTPLGASGWDDALGQKVLWMVSSQEQVAELSLNPPDLGPLQVTLSISNDQATATFVSQHADVRQALEAALPRLREMMAESGISLGGATVSSGGDGSQQQGFERQHRPGSRYSQGESPAGQGNGHGMIASNPGGKSRLVDIFA